MGWLTGSAVFIHPPVAGSQNSDLLSVNSCPSLSPSPSPLSVSQNIVADSKINFCDPRNLLVDSQGSVPQVAVSEFPPLPTLCSGDDEEHKLILGSDFTSSQQDLRLTKTFDVVGSTFTGLPQFDSFDDFDSENEFVTDLTRFSSVDQVQYLGDKRQRLDLISFDEEELLSEASFDDLSDSDQCASSNILTPPDSQNSSEDDLKMKPKKRSQKKTKKSENLDSEEYDAQGFSNGSEDVSPVQDASAQTSTAPSSDGNTAPSSVTPNTPSGQSTARRGRKQSLTDDPSKTFVCDICSRRFRRQEHLKRHHRSLHTHDKPFECNECGKKFSRSDNLSQHARTHGAGAIVMGVYEEGELPSGASLEGADTGSLGAALFEAARAAAGSSSSSSATISDRDGTSPAPSAESGKPAKKRKRED